MAPLLSYYYGLLLVQLKSLWSADSTSTFYYFSVTLKLFTVTSTVNACLSILLCGIVSFALCATEPSCRMFTSRVKGFKSSDSQSDYYVHSPRSWNIDESRNTARRSTFKRISSERAKKESYRLKLTVKPVYSPNPESEAFSYSARLCYGRFQHASSDLVAQSVHIFTLVLAQSQTEFTVRKEIFTLIPICNLVFKA